MASVNYVKLKTKQKIKAYFAHCDNNIRVETEYHKNEDINRDLTYKNKQLKGRDYKKTCQLFDERIAYLDSLPNANKRSDRVLLFGLDIPCPSGMVDDEETIDKWYFDVLNIVGGMYGKNNIMNMYVHKDEIHDYINTRTGEETTSRIHAHIYVVPEHEGRLNGKWFSSRGNMKKLNNAIQKMTEDKYHMKFMDGSQMKSKDTVEELKRQSEILKYEQNIKVLEQRKQELEAEISDLINDRDKNIPELIETIETEYQAMKLKRRQDRLSVLDNIKLDGSEKVDERSEATFS